MIYKNITELIGNTPLLEISPEIHGLQNVNLYAKLEYFNPFGSVKDRIAWEMIKEDLPEIKEKGQCIIESSSGNTAKALQTLASMNGTKLKCITNRIKQPEVKMIMQILGAEIEELPGKSQCYDPGDPQDPQFYVEKEIATNADKYFFTNQYFNEKNIDAHCNNTGKEILQDLKRVDFFVGGLGTTGSTKGTALALKEANPHLKVVGVVAGSDDLIPGIRNRSEMWEVGLFQADFYDEILEVHSNFALEGMLTLIRKTGILAGPTSGAAYYGALEYLKKIDTSFINKVNVVFIACDRFEWYLSYIKERRPELFQEAYKKDSIRHHKFEDLKLENMPQVSLSEAQFWIKENDPLIIDIRSNLAFKSANLPSSFNVPEEIFEKMVDSNHPFQKNRKILIVCPTGERSARYVYYLSQLGYQVFNLEGGVLGWRDAGYQLNTLLV